MTKYLEISNIVGQHLQHGCDNMVVTTACEQKEYIITKLWLCIV